MVLNSPQGLQAEWYFFLIPEKTLQNKFVKKLYPPRFMQYIYIIDILPFC